jgi:hypothetical protein
MYKQNPIPIILLLLLLVFFTSGCGGGDNFDNYKAIPSPDFSPSESNDTGFAATPVSESSQSYSEDTERIVIMNADMTISSRNPETVVDSVASMAQNFGGFVVSSNLRQKEGAYGIEVPEANITIRVPARRLQQAIETIKGLAGEVLYVSQTGQDVTSEYTDLQSRLRNLEEAAAQLSLIMETAEDTEDVLDVYQELMKVNEEAEVIRGQIQYYEQSAAYSSIDLTIVQIVDPTPTPTPWPTATPRPWKPGETFSEATEDLNTAFQRWINNMIRFFVYFVPTFIFRFVPWLVAFFFLGRWIYRRYSRKNKDE